MGLLFLILVAAVIISLPMFWRIANSAIKATKWIMVGIAYLAFSVGAIALYSKLLGLVIFCAIIMFSSLWVSEQL